MVVCKGSGGGGSGGRGGKGESYCDVTQCPQNKDPGRLFFEFVFLFVLFFSLTSNVGLCNDGLSSFHHAVVPTSCRPWQQTLTLDSFQRLRNYAIKISQTLSDD